MPDVPPPTRRRILDPVSRISEVLFGLIMALTFTGTLSAATAGREEVRTMLFGAVGCNIAWGIVDAVMYLVTRLTERGRNIVALRAARDADPEAARRIILQALPAPVASTLPPAELEAMRARLQQLPEPAARPLPGKDDVLGAIGVFLLVATSTFPVVVPFLLMGNAVSALRVSNAITIAMLFVCGYRLGEYSGNRGWVMGLLMAIIGSALVGLTIALGG